MTPEQAAAFVMAQAACAIAEVAMMQRANEDHFRSIDTSLPSNPPYKADDFQSVMSRYTIGHNDVLSLFQSINR